MTDYYSEQQISNLFDELIEVWAAWQTSLSAWSDFRMHNPYPREPEGVLDTKSLAEYRRAVSEHERNRERVDSEHRGHNRRYEGITSRVREILPRDSTVEHTYGGDNADLAGEYRISHDFGEHNQIRIERIAT